MSIIISEGFHIIKLKWRKFNRVFFSWNQIHQKLAFAAKYMREKDKNKPEQLQPPTHNIVPLT